GVMERLVSWDKKQRVAGISNSLAGPYQELSRMEMTIHQQWEIADLRVKRLVKSGNKTAVTFQEPESRVQFEHRSPAPVLPNGNSVVWWAEAVELVDEGGEWVQLGNGSVLYWPRDGEDLTKADAIVPALETLVKVEGTLDKPVSYVQFKGISFEHSTWTRPS